MLRATRLLPAARNTGKGDEVVELDFDGRHRRRIAMTAASGLEFLLDMPAAVAIADGDGLLLEDGRIVTVRARRERVAEITARDPEHLARIAWHLGNRHLPTEIAGERLRVRDDPVVVDMVRRLGGEIEWLDVPFQPEGGAYGQTHEH